MNHFFKNIRVIEPAAGIDAKVNLWVKDGIIMHCSAEEANIDSSTQIINADNLVAAPGLFDMHVHLREPGEEYKESIKTGTDAAANGGFTGVVCMPNTSPCIDDVTVVEYIKEKSKGLLTDVKIAAAITQKREGKLISPMLELNDAGVVYFTDDGSAVEASEMMRRAFDYSSTHDLMIAQHCEDHSLTKGFAMNETVLSYKLGLKGYPNVAEEIIVDRDIRLSKLSGNRRYHVSHISTKGALELVKSAKDSGLRVSCEVTPHHFTLTDELMVTYNTDLKMNPPLRANDDRDAIIEALKNGTIDCIATDHAPHALHEKEVEFEKAPCGIIGLETSLGLTLTNLYHAGHLSLVEIIKLMSVNPRRLLNIPEVKIEKGINANLTIFAPDEEWIVNKSNFKGLSKNTPFDGYKLKGKPKFAINNNLIHESYL